MCVWLCPCWSCFSQKPTEGLKLNTKSKEQIPPSISPDSFVNMSADAPRDKNNSTDHPWHLDRLEAQMHDLQEQHVENLVESCSVYTKVDYFCHGVYELKNLILRLTHHLNRVEHKVT